MDSGEDLEYCMISENKSIRWRQKQGSATIGMENVARAQLTNTVPGIHKCFSFLGSGGDVDLDCHNHKLGQHASTENRLCDG